MHPTVTRKHLATYPSDHHNTEKGCLGLLLGQKAVPGSLLELLETLQTQGLTGALSIQLFKSGT